VGALIRRGRCPKPPRCTGNGNPQLPGTRPTQNTAPYIDAMAAHKLPGEAARYNRLPDHDIDGDSEHSKHPASGTDANTPNSVASRSIVHRRRQEPRPFPIKAMSLVGLKNLFFKQTVTAIPKRAQPSREYGMNGTVLSTPTDSIEAVTGAQKGRPSAKHFFESFY
jgi:hypothetical protein